MLEIIFIALTLGIATGTSCLILCAPFLIPYFIAEERKLKTNFREFGKFLGGRLSGYLLFGLVAGYLGGKLNTGLISVSSVVLLGILAFIMILYSLFFFKSKLHTLTCAIGAGKIKPPFWIGLLTGTSLCPPFLLSLNYIFILGDVLKGVVFFFFFFIATNIYFVPVVFLGKLAYLKEFKILSRWAMLIIGLIFFLYSIYNLITGQNFNFIHAISNFN